MVMTSALVVFELLAIPFFPQRGQGCAKTGLPQSDFGLDLLPKAFASPCALLLGVLSDFVEEFSFHVFLHQCAVGGLALGRCAGQ